MPGIGVGIGLKFGLGSGEDALRALSPDGMWDARSSYTDAGATIPVSTTGDLAYVISDLSGNGRHWSQATSTKRASLVTGANPYLSFDGLDDFYAASGAALDNTVSTVAAAFMLNSGASSRLLVSIEKQALYAQGTSVAVWGGYNGKDLGSGYAASTDTAAIMVSRNYNDVDFYTNGNAVVNNIQGTAYNARVRYLGGYSTTQFANMRFYRMAIWLRELNSTGIATARTWLGQGMGLSL